MAPTPPRRNAIAQANLAQYQLFANCYRGSRWVRRPPQGTLDPGRTDGAGLSKVTADHATFCTYLSPFPNEKSASFDARVSRASYRNYCQDVVRVYLATLFSRGAAIDRQPVADAIGEDIFDDIDLRGSDAATFLRRALKEALVFGWVGALTDFAPPDADERPYSRIVVPPDVWDWERDPVDGSFAYLLVQEDAATWLAWYPDRWERLDATGASDGGHEHDLGEVPFDVLVCDDPSDDIDDEPFGHGAIRDVADMNIELYNVSSELEDLLRKTNYPQQHWKEQPEALKGTKGKTKPSGPDFAIITEAEVKWISPDVQAAATAMKQLDALELQIRRVAGVAARSEESTEAHSGAALTWEYSTKYDLVKLRGENLRSFEVALWRRYGELLGAGVPAESVRYPSEYATAPLPGELETLVKLNDLGVPAEIQRAQLRSITLKSYFHRPELPQLLAAAEAWEPKGASDGKPEPKSSIMVAQLDAGGPPTVDPGGAAEPPMMEGAP